MRSCLTFLFFITFLHGAFAQENNAEIIEESVLEPVSETFEKLTFFENDDPLEITLKFDITSFIRHKSKGEYINAEFCIHESETDSILKNIRLKARGNFRRGHCFFPPIYLNFKTDPIEEADLAGIKKIKLVTHCSTVKSYRDYVLKEYLVYKMFNVLSEKSFRVKLVNINYIDTGKKQRNYQQIGFLIEPLDLLVKRTNSVEIDPKIIMGENVVEDDIDVVALFNYMIANTDWRVKAGHNVKYIKSLDDITPKVIPVPYDFDYSGFVGAMYAVPQEWSSVKTISEREYLGYCRTGNDSYLKAIRLFETKKEKIFDEINTFGYLDEKQRINLVKFIEEYYELVEQPKAFVNLLNRECRYNDF